MGSFFNTTALNLFAYPASHSKTVFLPGSFRSYGILERRPLTSEYVLFPSLTVTANRGVYRATVVAGNVTAWTRIVYNPSASPTGESIMGDTIYITALIKKKGISFTAPATQAVLKVRVVDIYHGLSYLNKVLNQ